MLRDSLLVGCGNPLLDISAIVDDEFLKKYNVEPDNAILADETHKDLYNELIEKYNAEFIAGGSVQNSFRVAAWILEQPNVAVFFGCVGNDKYADILKKKAREDGVNVLYQVTDKTPTGTCGVLITGTHRSLIANLAAANHFTLDHLNKAENVIYLDKADYFYISGFFLTVSPPSIMQVAKKALERNRPFLMNLSAPFLSQAFKEPLMAAMPYVDIIFGNETEAETFAKELNFNTTDLKKIALKICELPKLNEQRQRIAVITQGHNPVILAYNNEITEFTVDLLPRELVIDTNGAGDAFVGGFLSQFVQEKNLSTCVRCGIWAARQIIQRSGCTFDGKPTFNDHLN